VVLTNLTVENIMTLGYEKCEVTKTDQHTATNEMGSICTAIPRVARVEASERGINTLAIVTLELIWTTNWRLHT
jgi:hypothetical protein